MGIRFRCHHCEHELHVKDFQGGKRGRCPVCQGRFRIPLEDADYSLQIESSAEEIPSAAASSSDRAQSPTEAESEAASVQVDTDVANQPRARKGSKKKRDKSGDPPSKPAAATAVNRPTATDAASMPPADSNTGADVSQPGAWDAREAPSSSADDVIWYVRPPSGGQYGPATTPVLEQWIAQQRVTADTLVWRTGWEQWSLAQSVFPKCFVDSAIEETPPNEFAEDQAMHRTVVPGPIEVRDEIPPPTSSQFAAKQAVTIKDEANATEGAYAANGAAASLAKPSIGERNRIERRQRRKRNYLITLSVLSVLAVVLIVALIIALISN